MTRSTSSNRRLMYFIPLSILISTELGIVVPILKTALNVKGFDYVVGDTPIFLTSFFEGFGIIYAFSLPIIITRAWDKLDNIAREFNSEVNAVKAFYENIKSIRWQIPTLKKIVVELLYSYVQHVVNNYKWEENNLSVEKIMGDNLLAKIKQEINFLNHPNNRTKAIPDSRGSELIQQLNNLISIRGNRIALSQQSGVRNLRVVGLITSILFVVPLYFVRVGFEYGLLDNIIVLGVTWLVMYIYSLVEDLDTPFEGSRKVSDESWQILLKEMDRDQNELEQKTIDENIAPKKPKRKAKGKK